MFEVVIIGAGMAGATLAERFAASGKKVLLIERRRHVAGNCYDAVDGNGILIHKYGPHLFHTDDAQVWEYLSRFTPWHLYFHRVRAVVDGKPVPIPFNLNTLREVFPQSTADKLEAALLQTFGYGKKNSDTRTEKIRRHRFAVPGGFRLRKNFSALLRKAMGLVAR